MWHQRPHQGYTRPVAQRSPNDAIGRVANRQSTKWNLLPAGTTPTFFQPRVAGTVRKVILPALAVQVMSDLHRCRLSNEKKALRGEMVRRDVTRRSPPTDL